MPHAIKANSDWIIVGVALLLSFGSLIFFAVLHLPQHAGVGGAAAVALSFAILFLRRGNADRTFEILATELSEFIDALEEPLPDADPSLAGAREIGRLQRDLKALTNALKVRSTIDGRVSRRQNRALAAASVVGTITWALGYLV